MNKCAAIKGDGTRCERVVGASQGYCYSHDPERVEERRRNASKAAKSKGAVGELAEAKGWLRGLAAKTLNGDMDTRRASVAAQVLGVYLRAIELERKVLETEELEERLRRLEDHAHERRAGHKWRA